MQKYASVFPMQTFEPNYIETAVVNPRYGKLKYPNPASLHDVSVAYKHQKPLLAWNKHGGAATVARLPGGSGIALVVAQR